MIMTMEHARNQLVARAQNGDRSAFDELVASLQDRVRGFVRSRIRTEFRDRLDADEILQDTFVRAYRSIGRFRGEDHESFTRWVMGIARIAVIKAVNESLGRPEFEISRDFADTDVSPSKALRRENRFDRLQEALDKLSGDYREVVYLVRIEGLSTKQVAEKIGRSPEAVKKLLGRALRRLREQLDDTESLHLPDRRLRREGGDHEG